MDWRDENEMIRLERRVYELEEALKKVLAWSDPLPPDGVDVHVAAQRLLDQRVA